VRFEKKIRSWAELVEQEGIDRVRLMRGDHRLSNRWGENREHIWTTALNHRYRLFYEIVNGSVRVLELETHNKQRY